MTALGDRIADYRRACAAGGIGRASPTAIQPVIVGDAARAVALSAQLRRHGQLVPAIRPPTVPSGTSRLRVSLSAAHSREQVAELVAALRDALADQALEHRIFEDLPPWHVGHVFGRRLSGLPAICG